MTASIHKDSENKTANVFSLIFAGFYCSETRLFRSKFLKQVYLLLHTLPCSIAVAVSRSEVNPTWTSTVMRESLASEVTQFWNKG